MNTLPINVATLDENKLTWTHKETDLCKPGNVKWLVSHLKWAATNSREVVLTRIPANLAR